MNNCKCKKILWFKRECQYCEKKRRKSNREWEKNHTFIYGEQVVVSDNFIGDNIIGTVVDRRTETYGCYELGKFYTSYYYSIKLPDGNIKEFSRYNIKKL